MGGGGSILSVLCRGRSLARSGAQNTVGKNKKCKKVEETSIGNRITIKDYHWESGNIENAMNMLYFTASH